MTRKTAVYRELLKSSEFINAPGVYDGYSVRLAERAGYASAARG